MSVPLLRPFDLATWFQTQSDTMFELQVVRLHL